MRRVVVTGLGLVTPLACGTEQTWQRLRSGESGIKRIEKFDVSDIPCKIAGQVPRGDGSDGSFNPDDWMEPKEQRKVDDFIIFAMAAAAQALNDAGWHPREYEDQITSGVLIGSGIGGVEGIAETALLLRDRGPRRVSPFFIPGRLINLASGYVSIAHSLKGPNHAVVTACSTGAHAIGDAGRLIALGDADVMLAGGTESPVNRISLAGARFRPGLTIRLSAHRGRMIAIATALSWGRAPAPSCSRNMSMRNDAARASTANLSATVCRAMPITLPRRPRTAMVRSAA
jgi:3-oxoacyl-[acyl-carrier-protein] synthase II